MKTGENFTSCGKTPRETESEFSKVLQAKAISTVNGSALLRASVVKRFRIAARLPELKAQADGKLQSCWKQ